VSSDWHEPANWDTVSVPGPTADVVLPAGSQPCVLDGADANVTTLAVQTGARFECLSTIVASGFVVVDGELHVGGTCESAGAMNFGQSASLSFDSGLLRANDAAFYSSNAIVGDGVLEVVPTLANSSTVFGLGHRQTPPIVANGPGTVELTWVDVLGDVALTDCNLIWGNSQFAPIIRGDLVLTNGQLVGDLNGTNGGLGIATVRGDVVLSGTGPFTGVVAMTLDGDWTSDDAFAFKTSDFLRFDSNANHIVTLGLGATVLPSIDVASGDMVELPDGSFTCGGLGVEGMFAPFVGHLTAASLFVDTAGELSVSGTLASSTAVTLRGRIEVNGEFVAPSITVESTGVFDLAAGVLRANDVRIDGALTFAPGAIVELLPTPADAANLTRTASGIANVPPVVATGPGSVFLRRMAIQGDLVLDACQLDWDTFSSNASSVAGDLELTGGALGGDANGTTGGQSFLVVDGDVNLDGVLSTAANTYVQLAGDWLSDDTLVTAATDVLRFAGTNLQTATFGPGTTVLPIISVAAGATLQLPGGDLTLGGLTVDGTLVPHVGDIECGSVSIGVAGSLDVDGSITAGGFLVAGVLSATGDLVTPELFDLDTTGSLGLTDGVLRARNATFDGTLLPGWTGSIEIVPVGSSVSNLKSSSGVKAIPTVSCTVPGALALQWVEIQGDLVLVGCQLSWASSSSISQVVAGDLLMTGGSLAGDSSSFGGDSFLTVRGDVVLSGVAATPASAFVYVEGDWTSDDAFVPTATDRFHFRGGTTHVMTVGANSTSLPSIVVEAADTLELRDGDFTGGTLDVAGMFAPLTGNTTWSRISVLAGGSASFDGDLVSTSSVVVGGTLAATGDLRATTSLTLDANGQLLLGTGELRANDIFVNGHFSPGWTAAIRLMPTGTNGSILRSNVGPRAVPSVSAIGPGTVQLEWVDVVGDVSLTSCVLNWSTNSTRTQSVTGSVTLTGGALGGDTDGATNGASFLVVEGDMTLVGAGASSGTTNLELRGDWSSDAAYSALAGEVRLTGTAPQSVHTGTGTDFGGLVVAAGADVHFADALSVAGAVDVFGIATFASGGDIGLDFVVHASGSAVAPPFGSLRVGGDFSAGGQLEPFETLVLDGAGSQVVSVVAPHQLGSLRIEKTGGVAQVNGPALFLSGDLDVSTGATSIASGLALEVDGDVHVQSGSLELPAGSELTVHGDFRSEPTASFMIAADITCVGDLISGPEFAPTAGTVVLAGANALVASNVVGAPLAFHDLVVQSLERSVAGELNVHAQSLVVASGARLGIANGATLDLDAPSIDVDGEVRVTSGAELWLAPTSVLTVESNGALTLVGSTAADVRLAGSGAGGAAVVVHGTLAARHATVSGLGADGLVVTESAAIAPAPDDLRGVTFVAASSVPGAALFTVDRSLPTVLVGSAFEDPLAVGTYNVRTAGPGALLFEAWSGAFGGATYEDDPLGLIDWDASDATVLDHVAATAGPRRVAIDWQTSAEGAIEGFRLEYGPTPSGPFTPLVDVPPLASRSYAFVHTGLEPDVEVSYRISRLGLDGSVDALATVSARPWNDELPPAVLTVGAFGEHATIQEAVDAIVAPGSIVLVAAGSYPSFTLAGPLPGGVVVRSDGSGPVVVDTTGGPVSIRDVPAGQWVWLSGLEIGTGSADVPGLVVRDSIGTVVLDELEVRSGATSVAATIDSALAVQIQDALFTGATGLRLEGASRCSAMRVPSTTLELAESSSLTSADFTPSLASVEPGSVWNALAVEAPIISVPWTAPLADQFDVQIEGASNAIWLLYASLGSVIQFDLPLAGWELPALLDPLAYVDLGLGVLDANGDATKSLRLPGASYALGYPIVLQCFVVDPTLGRVSASNGELLFGTP
jgi:cytoskeletal protein CcmA (bactofilin family)